MKALVVYESMYGNTAAVASAIADGIASEGFEVRARPVDDVEPGETAALHLVVVGGPTHAHGMSRVATRNEAASDEKNVFPHPTVSPGLREWIALLPDGADRPSAAFDTRIDKPLILTGSAAKGISRRLERRGFRLALPPECFLVTTENHLLDGEIEHALRWGSAVAAAAAVDSRIA
jgi:hypothetical protein